MAPLIRLAIKSMMSMRISCGGKSEFLAL